MNLYRLIYVSDTADYVDWDDLKDILAKSEKNNAALDVTGILVLSNNKFLQVLEGPINSLNELYAKILQDARHKNSRILSYTPIHERHFSAWSMKGVNIAFMQSDLKDFLMRKYGSSENGITVPEDGFLAFSFLFDVYHLKRS